MWYYTTSHCNLSNSQAPTPSWRGVHDLVSTATTWLAWSLIWGWRHNTILPHYLIKKLMHGKDQGFNAKVDNKGGVHSWLEQPLSPCSRFPWRHHHLNSRYNKTPTHFDLLCGRGVHEVGDPCHVTLINFELIFDLFKFFDFNVNMSKFSIKMPSWCTFSWIMLQGVFQSPKWYEKWSLG